MPCDNRALGRPERSCGTRKATRGLGMEARRGWRIARMPAAAHDHAMTKLAAGKEVLRAIHTAGGIAGEPRPPPPDPPSRRQIGASAEVAALRLGRCSVAGEPGGGRRVRRPGAGSLWEAVETFVVALRQTRFGPGVRARPEG